jgi:hypothetical protein
MLKTTLTIITLVLVFQTNVLAQIYVKNPGNVGIGVATPTEKLHIAGKTRIDAIDNVLSFYGPTNAWQFLSFHRGTVRDAWFGLANNNDFWLNKETAGNVIFKQYNGRFVLESGDGDVNIGGALSIRHSKKGASTPGNPSVKDWTLFNMTGTYGNGLQFWAYDNIGCATGGICGAVLTLHDNGNVGIGTTNPVAKLQVNGGIKATQICVDQQCYADYVFDSTYQLPPLQQVEAYIKQNHHLPEVPSEEEVTKNGINLSEHQVILLKKIEELTLYTIDQNKQLQEQASTQKAQAEKLQLLEKLLKEVVDQNNNMKEELLKLKAGK